MFVVLWRYSAKSEWMVSHKPVADEQAARAEINSMTKYDVSGRREYRYQEVGAPDTWFDPFAEEAPAKDAGA